MLHTKLYYGNCSHFSEREENVWLSISCLFQTIVRRSSMSLVSEYLTKDTAVSQKCQQNISKSLNATNTSCLWQQLPVSVHILLGEDYLLAHYRKFLHPKIVLILSIQILIFPNCYFNIPGYWDCFHSVSGSNC